MDLSNKTLGLLLVAAIVFSIGGTIISLDRLDQLPREVTRTTGFATLNDTGTVILNITDALSITLADSTIDFGQCQVNTTNAFSTVDSNQGAGSLDNDLCSNVGGLPDYLVLENDGNINANVTVQSNVTGSTFFNDGDSAIWYLTADVGGDAGCTNGNLQGTYTEFSAVDTPLLACDNLSSANAGDQIQLAIQANFTDNATGGGTFGLTFIAQNVI